MKQNRLMINIQKMVAMAVLLAIILVLVSSPFTTAAAVIELPDPCCAVIPFEEPPCCDSEANSCCFMLYPPSMCEICFVLTWFTDTACFEQFNGRDICEFIFEPPKM